MSWIEYYNLLEKYDGNLAMAKSRELKSAARGNPNNPTSALVLAKEKYRLKKAGEARQRAEQQELLIKKAALV